MKLSCQCGYLIPDQTDDLPNKAHLIPDQSWFELLNSIDDLIARAGERKLTADAAQHAAAVALIEASRLAYQCPSCGAVLIDGPTRKISIFSPCEEAESAIFRK